VTAPAPLARSFSVGDGVDLETFDWTTSDAALRPFVLVHGLASNARLWDGVAWRLAAAGHPVLAINQRGHGRSAKPDHGYDMVTVAADLAAVIDVIGWERSVVVGQSWGGNVVLELAAASPDRTAGVACIDGGFIDLSTRFVTWQECEHALAPPPLVGMARSRIEGFMRSAHPDWSDEGIAGALANFDVRDDGTIAPWLTRDRHLQILRGMWEHHPLARAAVVTGGVLWMPADSGDVAWTHSKQDALAAMDAVLARSRTVWFSPADHDVHAQHPDRVAAVLHDATEDGWFS
jgi:pimeloyl-ACP methyl ester carboxylesterase